MVCALSRESQHLDETLVKFIGSLARYIILAFVLIAVLNRFDVETASIVAMFLAATFAIGLALQGRHVEYGSGRDADDFSPLRRCFTLLGLAGVWLCGRNPTIETRR